MLSAVGRKPSEAEINRILSNVESKKASSGKKSSKSKDDKKRKKKK
jgi:hypothetical protein